jgi:predicted nucleic acid-binding protein
MSLYLDTSCLLKLFFPEPETPAVARQIAAEGRVVVSTLAKLEALVQLSARVAGGLLSRRTASTIEARLDATLGLAPYQLVQIPEVVGIAELQVRPVGKARHCPTLDRLHLAAMEALSLRRLFTNDGAQAAAARDLGFEVLLPRG